MTERHVHDLQRQIADQERLVLVLEGRARLSEAAAARDLLATLRTSLEVAQDQLAFERRKWGADPQITD